MAGMKFFNGDDCVLDDRGVGGKRRRAVVDRQLKNGYVWVIVEDDRFPLHHNLRRQRIKVHGSRLMPASDNNCKGETI